jgi:hypothetical protein
MSSVTLSKEETCERGRDIYERQLRAQLEPGQIGRFVAIDTRTGDFEVADEVLDAVRALRCRNPDAIPYIHRIGFAAAYKLGGRFRVARP